VLARLAPLGSQGERGTFTLSVPNVPTRRASAHFLRARFLLFCLSKSNFILPIFYPETKSLNFLLFSERETIVFLLIFRFTLVYRCTYKGLVGFLMIRLKIFLAISSPQSCLTNVGLRKTIVIPELIALLYMALKEAFHVSSAGFL